MLTLSKVYEPRRRLLLYALIDGITDEYFPILDRIDMRIDELEDEIYNKEVRGVTEEFLALKERLS